MNTEQETNGFEANDTALTDPIRERGSTISEATPSVAKDENPAQAIKTDTEPQPQKSSAGVIVLQWLTYAFWGWTLLFVLYLVSLVLNSFLTDADLSSSVPYAVAGTLVLLPMSFICDLFYARQEPVKKSGGAMVVMIIHAVIFALFGIGALIASVLLFVQITISTPSDFSGTIAWLGTLMVSFVLYGLTFVRTLNPLPRLGMIKKYRYVMLCVVGGFIIAAFVGPVARSWATRDDRDTVSYLSMVSDGVSAYIQQNRKLPDSLKEVDIQGSGKSLVERGLVRYSAVGKDRVSTIDPNYGKSDDNTGKPYFYEGDPYYFKYQLCVNYKTEQKASSYSNPYSNDSAEYKSSLYIYDHPSGEVCYKLRVMTSILSEPETNKNTQKQSV